MAILKKRQRLILLALKAMPGGLGTTREIAEKMNLHINGVARTLGVLHRYVGRLNGRSGDILWHAYGVPYDTKCAKCGHEMEYHRKVCLWRRHGAVRACDCDEFVFKSGNQRRLIKELSVRNTYD